MKNVAVKTAAMADCNFMRRTFPIGERHANL